MSKMSSLSSSSSSVDEGEGADRRLVIAEDPSAAMLKQELFGSDAKVKKPRKKHNRFNGMSEEEVAKRLLPDLIQDGLDILIVSFKKLFHH